MDELSNIQGKIYEIRGYKVMLDPFISCGNKKP